MSFYNVNSNRAGEDLARQLEQLDDYRVLRRLPRYDEIWCSDADVMKAFRGVTAVVAHNAKFDRAFATKRFPALAEVPWICSMSEIDWPELGFTGGRGIGALLTDAGFFLPDAHRAAADVWATTCLLASYALDGRAVASHMVETARCPTQRLYSRGAPFEVKDALKAAGYRWAPERKAWWIEGDPERIANEETWVRSLSSGVRPDIVPITWLNRHRREPI